jgi:hypothetical protein
LNKHSLSFFFMKTSWLTDVNNRESKMEKFADVATGRSAAVSFGKSALVGVSTLTTITSLPRMVSSLISMGASATVKLRGGAPADIRSVIARLNSNTEILSAAITLRGDRPVG